MTENEAIKEIRHEVCNEKGVSKRCHDRCMYRKEKCAYSMAIEALEEVMKYRELGTIEELKDLKDGKLSGRELAMIAVDVNKLKKYQAIGTIEECREARERQRGKKVSNRTLLRDLNGNPYTVRGDCPNCGSINLVSTNTDYCNACGQKLDWSDTP